MQITGFGRAGIYFVMSCRVGYGYGARGFEPWAVRVAKKLALAISSRIGTEKTESESN